jgi:hypothetical protein
VSDSLKEIMSLVGPVGTLLALVGYLFTRDADYRRTRKDVDFLLRWQHRADVELAKKDIEIGVEE